MFSYRQRAEQAGERNPVTPDGVPAPTGYYPNIYRGTDLPGVKPHKPLYEHAEEKSGTTPDWEQFDKTIMYQRHPVTRYSSTWVPTVGDRPPGIVDPLASGPVAPTVRMLSRDYRVAGGTSNTRNLDNNVVKFNKYGQQDGRSWTETIDPILSNYKLSPATNDSSLVMVAPSGPHGLHAELPKSVRMQTNTGRQKRPQQQGARVNRLANSQYTGQSYSASTQHAMPTTQAKQGMGGRRGR